MRFFSPGELIELQLALGFKPPQKSQHEAKLVDLLGLSDWSSNGLFHFSLGSISHTHDVKANQQELVARIPNAFPTINRWSVYIARILKFIVPLSVWWKTSYQFCLIAKKIYMIHKGSKGPLVNE